jgi:hypothetical protein
VNAVMNPRVLQNAGYFLSSRRPVSFSAGLKLHGVDRVLIKTGRDSVVSTATRFELDGPRFETRWKRTLSVSYPSR